MVKIILMKMMFLFNIAVCSALRKGYNQINSEINSWNSFFGEKYILTSNFKMTWRQLCIAHKILLSCNSKLFHSFLGFSSQFRFNLPMRRLQLNTGAPSKIYYLTYTQFPPQNFYSAVIRPNIQVNYLIWC